MVRFLLTLPLAAALLLPSPVLARPEEQASVNGALIYWQAFTLIIKAGELPPPHAGKDMIDEEGKLTLAGEAVASDLKSNPFLDEGLILMRDAICTEECEFAFFTSMTILSSYHGWAASRAAHILRVDMLGAIERDDIDRAVDRCILVLALIPDLVGGMTSESFDAQSLTEHELLPMLTVLSDQTLTDEHRKRIAGAFEPLLTEDPYKIKEAFQHERQRIRRAMSAAIEALPVKEPEQVREAVRTYLALPEWISRDDTEPVVAIFIGREDRWEEVIDELCTPIEECYDITLSHFEDYDEEAVESAWYEMASANPLTELGYGTSVLSSGAVRRHHELIPQLRSLAQSLADPQK